MHKIVAVQAFALDGKEKFSWLNGAGVDLALVRLECTDEIQVSAASQQIAIE